MKPAHPQMIAAIYKLHFFMQLQIGIQVLSDIRNIGDVLRRNITCIFPSDLCTRVFFFSWIMGSCSCSSTAMSSAANKLDQFELQILFLLM